MSKDSLWGTARSNDSLIRPTDGPAPMLTRPASVTGKKNGVASAFARLVEEAYAWCGVEREEEQEEEPASLRYRLEGTVRSLRCRLAIG